MKKGVWVLALAFLVAAKGFGALPERREMERLKLITALAVDGGERVSVTAVTGVRVTEDEEPEVLTGVGETLAEACRDLREGSARRAYLGQTGQLLVGEGQDLGQALDLVLSNGELRLDVLLYIVRGEAGAVLADSAGRTAGETGGEDPRGRTVGEALARLSQGEMVLVPALSPGEDGALAPAGWAAVSPRGIEGYLEEDGAMGALLLEGRGEGQVVSLPGGAAEVTAVRAWAGDGRVRCSVEAKAAQGRPSAEDLSAWAEGCIRGALEPGWDCWGLRRELAALRPWDWEELRETDVAGLDVEVTGKLVGRNEGRT